MFLDYTLCNVYSYYEYICKWFHAVCGELYVVDL